MPPLFTLADVSTMRGSADEHVHPLSGVTVDIAADRITVVVGPSGSGKSTLLRLLNRLEEAHDGVVSFHGRPIGSYDVLELRRRVGLLQQRPTPFPGTVLDNIRVARPAVTRDEAVALLERAGLGGGFLDRRADELSGGEAQRMCLARTLAAGPEVLLLDEATSALDAAAAKVVERTARDLAEGGLTVVLVTHDLRQARRLADDLVVLAGGEVVEHGPATRLLRRAKDERARAFLGGSS
ncbi:MAG TPA: ATP-binding cassette domain-containing protein [Mycobacteriales bacterium]|nr:ATP-binding cassette domain-containing protein [Mycobacteriales bacterium]